MIKKLDKCLYCGEKMESKTAKKKFCSDLHRVYWHRENDVKAELNFDKISDLIWSAKNSKTLKNIILDFNANKNLSNKDLALLNIHVKRVCEDKKIKL